MKVGVLSEKAMLMIVAVCFIITIGLTFLDTDESPPISFKVIMEYFQSIIMITIFLSGAIILFILGVNFIVDSIKKILK